MNDNLDYYIGLQFESDLDVTTVRPESFMVTFTGEQTPVKVQSVRYFPVSGELRLYIKPRRLYITQLYTVSANVVKDCDGNALSINKQCYLFTENTCEIEDISIAQLSCMKSGIPIYTSPAGNHMNVSVRVVNSAQTAKDAIVVFHEVKDGVNGRELLREMIHLAPNECSELSRNFEVNNGCMVNATLEK